MRCRWLLPPFFVALGLMAVPARAQPADPPTLAAAAAASPYGPRAGRLAVETTTFDWKDSRRDREVPVRLYFPKTGDGPWPVIVFSHGLGGSRDNYAYLGRHWASYGFVAVHLQHHGSDAEVWKGKSRPLDVLREAATPMSAVNRTFDVKFALDELERLNRDDARFKGRLDLKHIGMAGHSFGAHTTLAIAGEVFAKPLGRELSSGDPRVTAAIAMSAPVTHAVAKLDQAYGSIKIPVFHMTGTLDDSPIGETSAAQRRLPFDHSRLADRYLVIFKGGDHMIFSGRPRLPDQTRVPGFSTDGSRDAHFQALICTSTTAFWDAYLKGDAKAKTWLAEGGFAKMLGGDGTFEEKLKPAAP